MSSKSAPREHLRFFPPGTLAALPPGMTTTTNTIVKNLKTGLVRDFATAALVLATFGAMLSQIL